MDLGPLAFKVSDSMLSQHMALTRMVDSWVHGICFGWTSESVTCRIVKLYTYVYLNPVNVIIGSCTPVIRQTQQHIRYLTEV